MSIAVGTVAGILVVILAVCLLKYIRRRKESLPVPSGLYLAFIVDSVLQLLHTTLFAYLIVILLIESIFRSPFQQPSFLTFMLNIPTIKSFLPRLFIQLQCAFPCYGFFQFNFRFS